MTVGFYFSLSEYLEVLRLYVLRLRRPFNIGKNVNLKIRGGMTKYVSGYNANFLTHC